MSDIFETIAATIQAGRGAALRDAARFALTEEPDLAGYPHAMLTQVAHRFVKGEDDGLSELFFAMRVSASDLRRLGQADRAQLIAVYHALFGTGMQHLAALAENPDISAFLTSLYDRRQKYRLLRAKAPVAVATEQRLTPAQIRARLEAAPETAYLLRRQWPPKPGVVGRNWLGGLPLLPAHIPWPRTRRNGQPMHFWAQVDCAALPCSADTPLPADGVLLFFFDLVSEAPWPRDSGLSAVIHVPDADIPDAPTAPPPDLPEMHHRVGENECAVPRLRRVRRVSSPWPFDSVPLSLWNPRRAGLEGAAFRDGQALAEARLTAESAEWLVPARPRPYILSTSRRVDPRTRDYVRLPDGRAREEIRIGRTLEASGFPYCGAVLAEVWMELDEEHRRRRERLDEWLAELETAETPNAAAIARAKAQRTAFETMVAALDRLVTDRGPTTGLDPDTCAAFVDWLHTTHGYSTVYDVRRALGRVARRAVSDPALRRFLPDLVYRALDADLAPGRSAGHMLLGPECSLTRSTGGEGVRLLLLTSDPGLDWMFGDGGVVEFWIAHEDLVAHRWDRAYALIASA